ncbi:cupin domain-containing protein [Nonomuraea recticatena]|uniref:Cupin type-2 domain-containing protein n=1 Tax=Nonomuraea recticatena TaxID=46178 RepID=A0ABP6E1U6_9ACTN
MANKVVVRKPGEGDAFWVLGGLYEVKAASSETNGSVTVMHMTLPPGSGPPLHTHAGGEIAYVLEGTVRLQIGEESVEAGPDTFVYIPEGTLETFEPTSTARVLFVYLPGGLDEFFAEVGERAPSRELPPPSDSPPDVDRLIAAAGKYGVQMRPPA